jgi:hypothetical protein
MQPMIVAWPRSGMAPMTLYCGPGPERMLSGVMAVAMVAAEADVERAAAVMAATKTVLLNCMTDLLVLVTACVTPRAAALFRQCTT